MELNIKYWIRFSLYNLLIVALLGVLMRYKIGFDFPFFSQKNAQHAHSHFAFAGWITHTLYALLINFIQQKLSSEYLKQYKMLLIANLFCSYGMLVSFFIQGYGVISIILSTLTIVIACIFAFYYFKDLKKIDNENSTKSWFKAALWFNIISSLGTFYLAYIMISKDFNEHLYLAAVYFYLHFQYNGFFIFSCMGLFTNNIKKLLPDYKHDRLLFKLFFWSCIPAYFLSTLWANIPIWLYVIVVIAAIVQIIAWFKFLNNVKKASSLSANFQKFSKYLFLFVTIAFTIKLILQLGSTIPVLAKLAFGFRPVVIAYLHLVLLAVISVFVLAYLYTFNFIKVNKTTLIAFSVFIIGIFFNELVLAVQGFASFSYISIKYVNETLFGISLLLLTGTVMIVISQRKKVKES